MSVRCVARHGLLLGRLPASGGLLVSIGLCFVGCNGLVGGGGAAVQTSAVVQVITASDLARGIFNTGLVPGDEEGELIAEPAKESEVAGYIDPSKDGDEAPPTSTPGTVIAEEAVPASSEPASSEPASSEPASSEPASSEPASSEPASSEPASSEPTPEASTVSMGSLTAEPSVDLVPGDVPGITVTAETGSQPVAGVETRIEIVAPNGEQTLLAESFDMPEDAMAFVSFETPPLPEEGTYLLRSSVCDASGQVLDESLELTLQVSAERQPMATSALGSIMTQAAKFRYQRRSCSNRTCLASKGAGDCWAMSDWLWSKLEGAKINARIIQYQTSASTKHRTVQYVSGGVWRDLPYKSYGVSMMFRPTKSRKGLVVYRN